MANVTSFIAQKKNSFCPPAAASEAWREFGIVPIAKARCTVPAFWLLGFEEDDAVLVEPGDGGEFLTAISETTRYCAKLTQRKNLIEKVFPEQQEDFELWLRTIRQFEKLFVTFDPYPLWLLDDDESISYNTMFSSSLDWIDQASQQSYKTVDHDDEDFAAFCYLTGINDAYNFARRKIKAKPVEQFMYGDIVLPNSFQITP